MTRRVVVTGMAGLSPIGLSWETVYESLKAQRSAVQIMPEWQEIDGLRTHVAAPIENFELPQHYNRKAIRSMGRVSLLATRSAELALEDAGLLGTSYVTDGRMGVAYVPEQEVRAHIRYFSKAFMFTNV